ncbi:hypothetical protein RIF29_37869 [Crotalaria pallida]|uniref:Uncharacterized protein n=1 Tax=Crotalaria pallida TaxID=3830 RepID=A0AAN9E3N6_CROPI
MLSIGYSLFLPFIWVSCNLPNNQHLVDSGVGDKRFGLVLLHVIFMYALISKLSYFSMSCPNYIIKTGQM